MLFTDSKFFILVLITFVLFYLPVIRKMQSLVLIASSAVFYAYDQPYFLILLLLSILINTTASYHVFYKNTNNKLTMSLGVAFNLATLIFFKYSGLLAVTFSSDRTLIEQLITIPLPVGISFYTFQGISLLIDAFREKEMKLEQSEIIDPDIKSHFIKSFLFISFFPQLVAGPILKPNYFLVQIEEKFFKKINWEDVVKNLVLGYFFKIAIADNLKEFTLFLDVPYAENFSAFTMMTLLFGYSFQIFADFAGYSFIAIGLAELFGYTLIRNFEYPYIAKGFSEFWNRWHISLYHWFNEYVFNPMNFKLRYWGKWGVVAGLFITFSLSGIWHGASWNFAFWGIFHALLLIIEYKYSKKLKWKKWPKYLKMLIVFCSITISYLIFKIDSHHDLWRLIIHFWSNLHFKASIWNYEWYVAIYSLPIILYHLFFLLKEETKQQLNKLKPFLYALMLILIFNNAGSQSDFIYFRF